MRRMRNAAGIATAVWACWLGRAALGQAAAPKDLPEIMHDLGSEDFAVREGAQRALEELPASEIALLRQWEKLSTDEEIKAGLRARISEMELDVLLHPKPLSIDVDKASLEEVMAALNVQLGAPYLQTAAPAGGDAAVGKGITVHVKDQPLWEIIRQVNERMPVGIELVASKGGVLPTGLAMRLMPLPAGAAPRPITVADGVGIVAQTTGTPATGKWMLRCTLYVDPRVRIVRPAPTLNVDKALDQDGRPLSITAPANTAAVVLYRPSSVFSASATFAPARELSLVKELHATCRAEILEAEEKYKIDLTADAILPLETPMGKVTVDRPPNGNYTVRCEPPAGQAADATRPMPTVLFTVRDKAGEVVQSIWGSGARLAVPLTRGAGAQAAATVEFGMPTKTREVAFDVQLKDLPITVMPAAPAAAGGGVMQGMR